MLFYAFFITFNGLNIYSMYAAQTFVDTSHQSMLRCPSWKLRTPQSTVFIVIHLTPFSPYGKEGLTQDHYFPSVHFFCPPLGIGSLHQNTQQSPDNDLRLISQVNAWIKGESLSFSWQQCFQDFTVIEISQEAEKTREKCSLEDQHIRALKIL